MVRQAFRKALIVLGTACCFFWAQGINAQDNSVILPAGLRDVKGPVQWPGHFWVWVVLFGIVLGAGLWWMLIFRRARPSPIVDEPVDPRSAWQIAYDQLAALENGPLLSQGKFKEFYSELSSIIRVYFENRFHIRAPEMTTEEFLGSLEHFQDLTATQKMALKKFMDSCDIVKFAKYIPRQEEAVESLSFARQLVEATKGPEETPGAGAGPTEGQKGL